ncbi:MAG: hypothetical protein K2L45_06330 [Muribaculaceae bacterium]|nr:hypothetical protein [Muribaculaceae bacterium]MDE6632195.1 hypothetical protein [Muribaculaceae bacterium]
MDNKNINYITKHYKEGLFDVESALLRIKQSAPKWWTRSRIAAACIGAVVLTATAAVFVHKSYFWQPANDTEIIQPTNIPASEIIRSIDFENAPLPTVVQKIREVYGVEVTDMPADASEYSLSLHYVGSATDLVETINDILDTDMKIQE